jgi:hypothetical protein
MQQTALVVDNGLFVAVAMRLAKDGYKVLYYTPWENSSPLAREMAPGSGLEEQNVFRCNDRMEALSDGVDLVVIPDLYHEGFQYFVESHSEVPVFGPGSGQKLENDRWFLKELLDKHGHDVIASEEIEGVENLQKFIAKKENAEKIIKVSLLRGDMETFDPSKGSAVVWADDLKRRMGPIGSRVKFIAEDMIPDALEVGVDTFYRKGAMLGKPILGFEVKRSGVYLGTTDFSMSRFKPLADTVGGFFASTNYDCFFSNEIRCTKHREMYLIDATTRVPSPPGEVMLAAMKSFADVARGGAPDWEENLWFAEVGLYSDWLAEHYLEIEVPKEHRELFSFRCYCRIDGKDWAIPQDSRDSRIGSAFGFATTAKAAIEMADEVAKSVKAHQLDFDSVDVALEEVEKADAYGLSVGAT